jgi:folylpolyglutamate synthase
MEFEAIWRKYQNDSRILFQDNIQTALETVRGIKPTPGGIQVLVTGSLHLVGGALFFLNGGLVNGDVHHY